MKRTMIASSLDVHAARWVFPLALLSTLALPACSRAQAEIEPPAMTTATSVTTNTSPKVVYRASWAEYYKSISDLKAHADIAVVGTVSSISAAEQPQPNGPVYSIITLDVERTPWNRPASGGMPAATAPTTVSFIETGGIYQGVTYEIDDEPLYHVGDRVLLFFTEYSPGKFRVTGGPSGRFAIFGRGVVKPIVKDGVQIAAGTTEASFLASVQND